MADSVSLRAFICGHVQGTFFRAFVSRHATELKVTGLVRNLPDGCVEVVAEGDRKSLERLVAFLHVGPPAARVEKVVTEWGDATGSYPGFRIAY